MDHGVIVSGENGIPLEFGNSRSDHPTLNRGDRDSSPEQYRNILFPPIINVVNGGDE
jgi:hypothetical protein